MRSRLYQEEDIEDLLIDGQKSYEIEAIYSPSVCSSGEIDFRLFPNLRLLHFNVPILEDSVLHLPCKISWLYLNNFGFEYILCETRFQKLAVLSLCNCIWPGDWKKPFKKFPKLKVFYVEKGNNLILMPDFSCMLMLARLDFVDCEDLIELHESVMDLNLLEILIVSGSRNIHSLPENWGKMKSLQVLGLTSLSIQTLPESVGSLKELQQLVLTNCTNLSHLPSSICGIGQLWRLDLANTCITELPDGFHLLTKLSVLILRGCTNLRTLPPLPSSLWKLDCCNCSNLRVVSDLSNLRGLKALYLYGCELLDDVPGFESLSSLEALFMAETETMQERIVIHVFSSLANYECFCTVPTDDISEYACQLIDGFALDLDQCNWVQNAPSLANSKWFRWLRRTVDLRYENAKIRRFDPQNSDYKLPDCIGALVNLEELNARGCLWLSSLPYSVGSLRNAEQIFLDSTCIEELPNSIVFLEKLMVLSLSGCKMLKSLPPSMESMKSLEKLNLSESGIMELPASIGLMNSLKHIDLRGCSNLRALPQLPSSLETLDCSNCTSLQSILSLSNLNKLSNLAVYGCEKLYDVPGFEYLSSLKQLFMAETETEIKQEKTLIHVYSSFAEYECNCVLPTEDLSEYASHLIDGCGLDLDECDWVHKVQTLRDAKWFQWFRRTVNLRYKNHKIAKFDPRIPGKKLLDRIGDLVNLKVLDVRGCLWLSSLPDSVGSLKNVERILLDHTCIDKLPDSTMFLEKLEVLSLCGCKMLKSLPPSMESLKSLQMLDLTDSGIRELPASIGLMNPQLKRIDLSGCLNIKTLPQLPSSLETLNCGNCTSLESMSSFSNLNKLSALAVYGCEKLENIPGFECLTSLKRLDMADLFLDDDDEKLNLFFTSCVVNISCSCFAPLETIHYIPSLKEKDVIDLDLGNVAETFLGSATQKWFIWFQRMFVFQLQKLQCLDVVGQRIPSQRLQRVLGYSVRKAKNLLHIHLDYTGIDELHFSILHLERLKVLSLCNCEKLETLPSSMGSMKSLQELWLSGAGVVKLPPDFWQIPQLKLLILKGCNKMRTLPKLPSSLITLDCSNCAALRTISTFSNLKDLKKLALYNSEKLKELPGLEDMVAMQFLDFAGSLRPIGKGWRETKIKLTFSIIRLTIIVFVETGTVDIQSSNAVYSKSIIFDGTKYSSVDIHAIGNHRYFPQLQKLVASRYRKSQALASSSGI